MHSNSTRPIVPCAVCATPFVQLRKERRYCSSACGHIAAAAAHRKDRISRCCPHCGKIFEVLPHFLKYQPDGYCSTQCANQSRSSGYRAFDCAVCSKRVEGTNAQMPQGRFCSIVCRRKSWAQSHETRTCGQCGREFVFWLKRLKQGRLGHYCSVSCADRARRLSDDIRVSHERAVRQRWNARTRKERLASHRQWAKAHPENGTVRSHRRRVRFLAVARDLTVSQWRVIKASYRFKCAYCGARPKRLTMDHIIPIIRGGAHTAANVVPACMHCNTSKRERPAPTFQPLLVFD